MYRVLSKNESKKLRKKMIDLEISQVNLARNLGYSKQHLNGVINGKFKASERILNFLEDGSGANVIEN